MDRWRLPGRSEAAADQLAKQQEQYQHLIEKGERTAQQGDHRHAAEYFRQAAELRPRYAEPHLKRAECLLELGETAQALAAFRQVVELQPGSGWSYYRLGAALVAAEQHAEAIEHLQRACELLPDLAHARLLLAHSHLSQSQYGRAVHHYKQVLEPLPQAHEAHHGLGLAYARLAAWDLAMESLKKAIEIQRDFGPGYSDLIDTILAGYPHRANEASGWADLARSQGIDLRPDTAGRLQETLARGRYRTGL